MEKLDYLLWKPAPALRDLPLQQVPGVRAATVQLADPQLPTTLLMGSGPQLAALVQIWLSSYDLRRQVEQLLAPLCDRLDGYLVTESEPQPDTDPSADLLSHVTWFPKPERLTEEAFLHGWHEVHTPHSTLLHPRRRSYLRDTAVRTLTAGSPPVRALVVERFAMEDYADPRRLFGGSDAMEQNMRELPGYADLDAISCCPMRQVVLASR